MDRLTLSQVTASRWWRLEVTIFSEESVEMRVGWGLGQQEGWERRKGRKGGDGAMWLSWAEGLAGTVDPKQLWRVDFLTFYIVTAAS